MPITKLDLLIQMMKAGDFDLPVKTDEQGRLILASDVIVDVGDISIGTVLQGAKDETAEPWDVKAAELEQKLDDILDRLEDGTQKTQLTGHVQEFAVSDWNELDPDDVPIGSVAQLIGTDDIRQTDGQEWIRL